MAKKRTNFKAMDCNQFIAYLQGKPVLYDTFITTTVLGISVVKVNPKNKQMTSRVFDKQTGKQLDSNIRLTQIDIESKQLKRCLIKIIDEKIKNMSTKGVYHPRRLQHKWQSLTTYKQKLELFRKYMNASASSIGFLRLIKVNLPNKTLESIIIDNPQFEKLIDIDGLRQKCLDKFKQYENGRTYLKTKQLL